MRNCVSSWRNFEKSDTAGLSVDTQSRRFPLIHAMQNFIALFQFVCILCQLQKPVKIALEQLVLHDAIFFKLAFCKRFGDLVGHPAAVLQNLMLVELQKAVEAHCPILHGHGDVKTGLIFRIVQIHGDDPLQRLQLILGQIILRNGQMLSVGETHVGMLGIGYVVHDIPPALFL